MSKKLAIQGYSTRGKEIIELLEMMGGKNIHKHDGEANAYSYYLFDNAILSDRLSIAEDDDFEIFTLQDFLEKFPYKVGDKVHIYVQNDDIDGRYDIEATEITSMRWNPARCKIAYKMKDINREFYKEEIKCKVDDELVYCERFKNLMDNSGKPSVKNHKMGPKSKLPSKYYEDRMEETQSKREYDELRMPLDDDDKLATKATIMGKRILPPDGYLVGKITQTDNGMLVEYVEKKPKYPKTYKECCDVLGIDTMDNDAKGYKHFLVIQFQELLIACDAYWKMAGEQMGLDKPWEPDFTNDDEERYGIYTAANKVVKDFCGVGDVNTILTFPTEEMRDAFFENFKDLIEKCKELL